MPRIDVKCLSESCDTVFEHYRPLSEWPKTPPCVSCGGETEQAHLPRHLTWSVDPVVVFKAPDGSFRFPGDANGISSKNYEKLGYERQEIRGAAEMRSFERKMNQIEYSRAQRKVEAQARHREASEKVRREKLREMMQHMSAYGRDVARAAIDQGDRRPAARAHEAGFHSEVYAYDRSNRAESRDAQGRRRRD